ncbi:MAG: HAMP domain-containing sensor histidine kinase [Chitinophagaceae bacterium]
MTAITSILLENEMDVVVAQKRMMRVAEFFSLNLSTQTTISTAVAEICRVVIDKTDSGEMTVMMEKADEKYFLCGVIDFNKDIEIRSSEEGLRYAKLLVPTFNYDPQQHPGTITVRMGIPRSIKISSATIRDAIAFFEQVKPTTPYEQLKYRNSQLSQQAVQIEEELFHTKLLDEKKNEFISVASHELKSPLTTLKAFTQLAVDASRKEGSPTMTRYMEKIHGQVQKLQVLIQQLLDVSKIESGKMDYNKQSTGWNGYMEDILPILNNLVPAHKVHWTPLEKDHSLNMDGLRMEQVFTNIISNAAKYSSPGTSIHIEGREQDGKLSISIQDEGIGIDEKNLEKIFQKYYRDENVVGKYSGFGMGLYITSGIVEEHGGRIWAESKKDHGTTFWFVLPVQNMQDK